MSVIKERCRGCYGDRTNCAHGRVRLVFFSQTRRIYSTSFRMTIGLPDPGRVTQAAKALYPLPVRRIRDFVIGFLQIPPRGGHPCLDGWLRSLRSMRDFHPLNTSHTEQTRPRACPRPVLWPCGPPNVMKTQLWGGQSWPQPPFRRPEPAESRLRAELPALQATSSVLGFSTVSWAKPAPASPQQRRGRPLHSARGGRAPRQTPSPTSPPRWWPRHCPPGWSARASPT